eukprot:TRINITY_DN6049_c0_g1_i2.p1 TRINITY_DN6049_c0_g1~~TRINITY_DN6049_c0_g1_i2.p1  ORF type:complete len:699 (-),score=198.76 TRINITY_DN6049_c0_g1_i2:13-2109(-)
MSTIDPMEQELMKRLVALTNLADVSKPQRSEVVKNLDVINSFVDRVYLSPERERCKVWASELGFNVVSECSELPGFRIYAVEEWILDSETNRCIVHPSPDPTDVILVTAVRPSGNMSQHQERFLRKFFLPVEGEHTYTQETKFGSILCQDNMTTTAGNSNLNFIKDKVPDAFRKPKPKSLLANQTLVHVIDGDFDKHINTFKIHLTLRRLSCGYFPIEPEDPEKYVPVMEQKMRNIYGINSKEPMASSISTFILEIQWALFNMKFLPSTDACTGMYDRQTMNAVKVFQMQCSIPKPTGYFNGHTYQAFLEKIMQLKFYLITKSGLGSQIDDPWKEYKALHREIKTFESEMKRNIPSLQQLQKHQFVSLHGVPRPISPEGSPLVRSGEDLEDLRDRQFQVERMRKEMESEKENLRFEVSKLQQLLEAQNAAHKQLKSEYSFLESKYRKLRDDSQAILAKIDLSKIQLKETKKGFNALHNEWSHTNSVLREHNETIQGYVVKIHRLEEKIQIIQREKSKNGVTHYLMTLLTGFLSVFAILILCVTGVVDFFKKLIVGKQKGERTMTSESRGFLLKIQRKLAEYARDFHLKEPENSENPPENLSEDDVPDQDSGISASELSDENSSEEFYEAEESKENQDSRRSSLGSGGKPSSRKVSIDVKMSDEEQETERDHLFHLQQELKKPPLPSKFYKVQSSPSNL